MVSLIQSVKHKNQLAGLKVISGLALSSETAAKKLLTKELLNGLKVHLDGLSHCRCTMLGLNFKIVRQLKIYLGLMGCELH